MHFSAASSWSNAMMFSVLFYFEFHTLHQKHTRALRAVNTNGSNSETLKTVRCNVVIFLSQVCPLDAAPQIADTAIVAQNTIIATPIIGALSRFLPNGTKRISLRQPALISSN